MPDPKKPRGFDPDAVGTTPLMAEKAEAIAIEATGASGYGFDPAIIIAIIQAVIRAISGCKETPAEASYAMRRPGLLARFVVRRECRKRCHNKDQCDCLVEAVLDAGANVSPEEAATLMAEAK